MSSGHDHRGGYPPPPAGSHPAAGPGPAPGMMAPPPGAPPGAGWGGAPGPGWAQTPPMNHGGHPGPGGTVPWAPFGVHPLTGIPYSDKQKIVAGMLQLFLPFGAGRFYTGHTGLAVAQFFVTFCTCGIGSLWSFIDGIMMLTGSVPDVHGRPLRD